MPAIRSPAPITVNPYRARMRRQRPITTHPNPSPMPLPFSRHPDITRPRRRDDRLRRWRGRRLRPHIALRHKRCRTGRVHRVDHVFNDLLADPGIVKINDIRRTQVVNTARALDLAENNIVADMSAHHGFNIRHRQRLALLDSHISLRRFCPQAVPLLLVHRMANQTTRDRADGSANQCALPRVPSTNHRARKSADGSARQCASSSSVRSSIRRLATGKQHRRRQPAQTQCIALHIKRLDAQNRPKFKKTGTSLCIPEHRV